MENITTMPVVPERNEQGFSALQTAREFIITTAAEYAEADHFCVGLKLHEKKVDEAYDDHITAAHAAHKALVAKKKKYAEPIEEARRIIKGKMSAWQEAEERRRQEEESRLQAEAKKQAEKEAHQAAEAARKAGNKAEAKAILAAPVEVPVIILPSATPKTQTTIQTRWTFRIADEGLIPREYLTPDTAKIGGVVRATKGTVNIPGIYVYSQKV